MMGIQQPDGGKKFPAKDCKDLKLCHPEITSGVNFIFRVFLKLPTRCSVKGNSFISINIVLRKGDSLTDSEPHTCFFY